MSRRGRDGLAHGVSAVMRGDGLPRLAEVGRQEAEVLAPEVVSGTVMLLATRPAIRAGPLGEPRPITAARPGR